MQKALHDNLNGRLEYFESTERQNNDQVDNDPQEKIRKKARKEAVRKKHLKNNTKKFQNQAIIKQQIHDEIESVRNQNQPNKNNSNK